MNIAFNIIFKKGNNPPTLRKGVFFMFILNWTLPFISVLWSINIYLLIVNNVKTLHISGLKWIVQKPSHFLLHR